MVVAGDLNSPPGSATLTAFERFVGTDDPGTGFVEEPIFRGFGPSGAGRTDNCTDPADLTIAGTLNSGASANLFDGEISDGSIIGVAAARNLGLHAGAIGSQSMTTAW